MDPFAMAMLNQMVAEQLQAGAPQPQAAPAELGHPGGLADLAARMGRGPKAGTEIKMAGKGRDKTGRVHGERHPLHKDYMWDSELRQYVKINPGSLR